ncbi:hypothetical protein N7G274_007148 [Stereocaulon virgatum]|uniref:EVE domain-containing protein n=1 Tax=Stereocaulon virgatum TaxID=373712 RepID=A0ABR4A595_9LECA
MTLEKRKANAVEEATTPPSKRGRRSSVSNKNKKVTEQTAASTRPTRLTLAAANASRSLRSSTDSASTPTSTTENGMKPSSRGSATKSNPEITTAKGRKTPSTTKNRIKPSSNGSPTKSRSKNTTAKGREKRQTAAKARASETDETPMTNVRHQANLSVDVSAQLKPELVDEANEEHTGGPSYWLMKAEPDSRIEKGKDVKFSIDDLKASTAPEGWDGVRNYVARNNMRLMMKGDLAFFYHSNCKVPGIVGIMEIVQEHSVDESAFDPQHPYYDEKSNREKPKWCLVHVEFRQKFPEIIKLKDLQKYAKEGGVLEDMQVLKQSRLSVSKVTKKEWNFITSLVDVEDIAAAAAQHQPQVVA